MVAPVKETKMVAASGVKMRLLRDFRIDKQIRMAGEVVEVSEELAKELERPIPGPYNFIGDTDSEHATRDTIRKAVRV